MATQFGTTTLGGTDLIVGASQQVTNFIANEENSAIDVGAISISLRTTVAGTQPVRIRVLADSSTTLLVDTVVTVLGTTFQWYTIPLSVRKIVEISGSTNPSNPTPNSRLDLIVDNQGSETIRIGRASASRWSYYYTGAAVFDPTASQFSPTGGAAASRTNTPLSWKYDNPGGQDLSHYRLFMYNNSNSLIGDSNLKTDTSIAGTVMTKQYNSSEFTNLFTELAYGNTYKWQVYLQYIYTANGHSSVRSYTSPMQTFSVPLHVPVVTITGPISGGLDLTPQLQATYSDALGHSRDETQWEMRTSTGGLLGFTVPDTNTLTPTYDPTNATVWDASSQALEFGKTYIVRMRARCNDGQWSNWASRSFSIASYTPTVTITEPTGKTDDLTPTISANYFSTIGAAKQSHRVQVLNQSKSTVLGDTGNVTDANTSFSVEYGPSDFSSYTPLENGTQYYVRVTVTDNGAVSGTVDQLFRTNAAPTAPTSLSPSGGQEVYTLTPTLSAVFNDPDPGDTPTVMEVELRKASDSSLIFQRTESDNNTTFTSVFVSDNLEYNETYTWRTRFQDQANVQGAWSSWVTFVTREGVTVTLTHPENNETLDSPIQTFTWNYSHPSGSPQVSGRLRIFTETSIIPVYDTGVVSGSFTSHTLPPTVLQNNTIYRAVVEATDASGQTGTTGFVYFATLWLGPDQPDNIDAVGQSTEGRVLVTWSAVDEADFVAYRVYRRQTGATDWFMFDEITEMQTTSTYYYFSASGVLYDFSVSVVENSTGANLESTLTNYATAAVTFREYTWLNDQLDPGTFRVRLMRNPTRTRALERTTTFHQPLGRRSPVAHTGLAYTETISTSFGLVMPYNDIVDMLDDLIDRYAWVLYRDGRGVRRWVNIRGYSIEDVLPNRATLSLEFTVIDAVEQ